MFESDFVIRMFWHIAQHDVFLLDQLSFKDFLLCWYSLCMLQVLILPALWHLTVWWSLGWICTSGWLRNAEFYLHTLWTPGKDEHLKVIFSKRIFVRTFFVIHLGNTLNTKILTMKNVILIPLKVSEFLRPVADQQTGAEPSLAPSVPRIKPNGKYQDLFLKDFLKILLTFCD